MLNLKKKNTITSVGINLAAFLGPIWLVGVILRVMVKVRKRSGEKMVFWCV